MKTRFFIFAMPFLLCLFTLTASSQEYNTGPFNISLGWGGVPTWGVFEHNAPDRKFVPEGCYTRHTGPFYIKAEAAITSHLYIGGSFSYLYNRWSITNSTLETDSGTITFYENRHRRSFSILLRANWHFGPFRRFDPYIGAGIGYNNSVIEGVRYDPVNRSGVIYRNPNHLGLEVSLGARFYLNPYVAVYGEAGLSKSVFQLGATINVPGRKYNRDTWSFPSARKH